MTDRVTGGWESALWTELDTLQPEEQFIIAGLWITRMTQVLLPALGARRRENVLYLIEENGWDTLRVAEELGTRRATVARLADEGRTKRKAEYAQQERAAA